jgi:hypothetical protein
LEVDAASQPTTLTAEQIGNADLLIGLLVGLTKDELGCLRDSLKALPGSPRVAVLQSGAPGSPAQPPTPDPWEHSSPVVMLPWSPTADGAAPTAIETFATAYQSIFAAGTNLDVKACCVVASKIENPAPGWVCRLVQPLLAGDFDLVAPSYSRRRFEGLLNSSIVGPLTRSLYGKRIQNPMGPDLGVSRKLFEEVVGADEDPAAGSGLGLIARLAPIASRENFRVCQAYLGSRVYPPLDWTNASSLLTEILGPVFSSMEKNAPKWQQMRGSALIVTLNEQESALSQGASPAPTIDVGRLINSFQLGMRDLQEIWRLVLPPATLFELHHVSPQKFRIPDELWVRIIYDFALAHRLRTINRTHLLRSLTPLYLGWVASYALETEAADSASLNRRLERLSIAYEAGKPYLISRWRWPDRFNP